MGSVDAIIRLVARVSHLLLDLLKGYKKKESYKKRQKERSSIEETPTDWFGEHFDGDRVQFDAEPEPDASKTDKAKD